MISVSILKNLGSKSVYSLENNSGTENIVGPANERLWRG
jgi:hypothetical protein